MAVGVIGVRKGQLLLEGLPETVTLLAITIEMIRTQQSLKASLRSSPYSNCFILIYLLCGVSLTLNASVDGGSW